jgi:hypothetical protein
MDAILENDVSFNEFKTYFETLNVLKQKEFVQRNFDAIKSMKDADKLALLCNHGFFNALVPLTKCGNQDQLYTAYMNYYGGVVSAYIAPSRNDEIELIEFASDKLYLIKYLREYTLLLDRRLGRKGHLVTHLCKHASQEVIDYLFNWVVKKKVFLSQPDAKVMFAKANYQTIIKYIDYVRGLSGDRDYVNYPMIVSVFERQDLTKAEKEHIMLFALCKMKVCAKTVSMLRKNGFLD